MDDGLAEKLFNAYRASLVANVLLKPFELNEMNEVEREPWQAAAVAARQDASERDRAEIEMLRGANAGWQREGEKRRHELHEALGFHPGDLHEFTWQDLLNAVRRDLRVVEGVRRALEGL